MEALVYTVAETAAILKCSDDHVYNLKNTGELRPVRGRPIRFKAKDVLAMVGADKTACTSFEAKRLRAENDRLRAENTMLRSKIRSIFNAAGMVAMELEGEK